MAWIANNCRGDMWALKCAYFACSSSLKTRRIPRTGEEAPLSIASQADSEIDAAHSAWRGITPFIGRRGCLSPSMEATWGEHWGLTGVVVRSRVETLGNCLSETTLGNVLNYLWINVFFFLISGTKGQIFTTPWVELTLQGGQIKLFPEPHLAPACSHNEDFYFN